MGTLSDECEKARKEADQAFIVGMVFIFLVVAAVRVVNHAF